MHHFDSSFCFIDLGVSQKKARRATTGGSGSAKKKKTAATAVQQPAVKRIRFTTKDGAVFGEDGWEDEEEDRRDDNGDDKDEEEAFDQKFEDMELDEEAEQYAPAPVTVVSAAAGRSKRNVPQVIYDFHVMSRSLYSFFSHTDVCVVSSHSETLSGLR